MKCPLFYAACISKDLSGSEDEDDCLGEECAWWDDKFQQCIIFTIGEIFYNLRNDIKDIKEKMPHLEQFKRA